MVSCVFPCFKDYIKAQVFSALLRLAGINFCPFSMKIQIMMQSDVLIKMNGLVTKELNRPNTSLTTLSEIRIFHCKLFAAVNSLQLSDET